jgi:Ca-activated chloride channel family protein
MKKQLLFLLLLSLVLSVSPTLAQTDDDAPIKIDTLLLTIPLTVSDRKGRNVPGLKKENFSIYQDGARQSIAYFFNEDAPMNVAILLDTSFSTREVLDKIQKAARDFLKVLRPEDKAVIVSFDAQTQFLSGLTSDRKTLTRAVNAARIGGQAGSDMNDAVSRVVAKYFSQFEGRKAIIVLTDGMAMSRSLGAQATLNLLQESDTIFYPIIFKTDFYTQIRSRGSRPLPIELMKFLAEETAGRFYEKEVANLKEAFQSISEEMKKQYLLGFYPQESWHGNSLGHIRVAVEGEGLKVNLKKRRF